jgi:methylmalonyl-CoA mutase
VEKLTQEIAEEAWKLIEEVEKLGGMTKAIEKGIPKMRIEEAAAKKQARIDSSQDVIVGVNKYRLDHEDDLQILEVDNAKVRQQQMARLDQIRSSRDSKAVEKALEEIRIAAKKAIQNETNRGNLLALAVQAAKARATLGEISDAMESAFGRYKAKIQSFTGVYSKEIKNDESFKRAQKMADEFALQEGRRPRIMVAKMGQDGHDRGAKVVATGYADLGFDVDIGPLFQTPAEVAKQAVENDVHILGISSLAGGHKTLVPEVIQELKKQGREDIMIIVGGVIPKQDYKHLLEHGAVAVFGPGSKISDAAIEILKILMD